jgi:hypothetical protein
MKNGKLLGLALILTVSLQNIVAPAPNASTENLKAGVADAQAALADRVGAADRVRVNTLATTANTFAASLDGVRSLKGSDKAQNDAVDKLTTAVDKLVRAALSAQPATAVKSPNKTPTPKPAAPQAPKK